jgi:DNA polymerase
MDSLFWRYILAIISEKIVSRIGVMKNLKNALLLKQLYHLQNLGYSYTDISPYHDEILDFNLLDSIELLKEQVEDCQLCTLSQYRNKVVFGEGNVNAKLMIVGDFPSNSDNSRGEIFTDRAGELLTKMIENVLKLSREEVYITNLLKCYPLDTQNPSATYAHTCYPYLQKEIALLQPKVILALGTLSYEYLSNSLKGNSQEYRLVSSHHPSDLLRNPSKKQEAFADLKKVKGYL